ncbi:glycosyltransferase family 4 protein [Parasediminibacterium sp. JCM 36343]|uniref:glycosyltransferase family 4 protein n=1 Tax=Parasediminibacterium sp. JCM 36343 TaxID=3374279 RepID=UPI00397CC866
MKILFTHPIGNQNVKNLARFLAEDGMIETFITSIAVYDNSFLEKLAKTSFLKEFERRRFAEILKPTTKQFPLYELMRFALPKLGINRFNEHETGIFSIDGVGRYIDDKAAAYLRKKSKNIGLAYCYEDCALNTFSAASALGIKKAYDLPIGYWKTYRQLLSEEKERRPEWAATITGFKDSDEKLEKKDKELALADVIYVASAFTAKTLEQNKAIANTKKVIVPYGFPPVNETKKALPKYDGKRALKLLYVGGLTQRKGIASLFEAVEHFKEKVTLTIVGSKASEGCKILDDYIKKHQWIPTLPHDEILKTMHNHDVLIFPSLFEGFGLVITEAMSQGTPVVTTNRTVGESFIRHNENGWLVKPGDTEDIIKVIDGLLLHPDTLGQISNQAKETAKKRTWQQYGDEMAADLRMYLNR